MKAKWHIGVIIILFTILGVVSQQPVSTPNQEIVLQFSDEVTSLETQNTIAIVKQQLQSIGVENIQIRKEEGKLKITYFSDKNVADVKRTLSKDQQLVFNNTSKGKEERPPKTPAENNSIGYEFDVYEIQKSKDLESGFEGRQTVEPKLESDRFFNPNVYFSMFEASSRDEGRTVKIAYKLNRNIALAIDNTSRKVPEVRAGPIA